MVRSTASCPLPRDSAASHERFSPRQPILMSGRFVSTERLLLSWSSARRAALVRAGQKQGLLADASLQREWHRHGEPEHLLSRELL